MQNRLQGLHDLHRELELKYAEFQGRLQRNQEDDDRDVSATRDSLLRENRALRQRNDAFQRWEFRVNVLLGRQEDERVHPAKRDEHRPFRLAMKQPLTVE